MLTFNQHGNLLPNALGNIKRSFRTQDSFQFADNFGEVTNWKYFMDTNIWTAICSLVGALIGAAAAIVASYLSNHQQFEQKNQDKKIKQVQLAFSIADKLLNDTEILIESKLPLLQLSPQYHDDFCGDTSDPEADLYKGIANRLDRRKRPLNEFFNIDDLGICEKLKQLCDLYTDEQASSTANQIYCLIKGLDANFEFARATDEDYDDVCKDLQNAKNLLIELKKQLKEHLCTQKDS